jgi:hypothetical protein
MKQLYNGISGDEAGKDAIAALRGLLDGDSMVDSC